MFVFSFKASTLKYIGVMSLCAMAVVMTVALVPSDNISTGFENKVVEVAAERKTGDFKNVKTNEDRVSFLESYGWQVGQEPSYSGVVTIPEEFNAVYEEYNELQKTLGLNLGKYRGKEVELYSYPVTNAGETAYATLLIYKNKVIGGDVSSASPDGFITSFEKM